MAYRQWYENQLNRPDRTDYYLMQIALEVKRVLSTKPGMFKLQHFELDFASKEEERKRLERMTPAEKKEKRKRLSEMAKAIWRARLGMKKEK